MALSEDVCALPHVEIPLRRGPHVFSVLLL